MSESKLTLRPSEHCPLADIQEAAARAHGSDNGAPQEDSENSDLPVSASPPLGVVCPQQRDSVSGVQLQLFSDLAEVAGTWKAFERHADRTVFQSFDWLAAWQHHIGARQGTAPAIVLGRDDDCKPLFILQLAVEPIAMARRLTWLGSELCDYNAPLLAEQFSDRMSTRRFARAWRDALLLLRAEPCFQFDLIDLQKMPETIGEQRNPFLDLGVTAHPSGAYLANLAATWEEFYAAKRSSATRKRERRQLKQLGEHGAVRFIDIDAGDEAMRTLAPLFEQKSRAFARMGVDDPFARPGRREFFCALAGDSSLRELVHVSRLDVGSAKAAINIGLKFRGCYYLILSSYEDGELARFGPGRAHLNELLRNAIARGFVRFDFTVGDEPYKRDWCDMELELFDHLAAVSLRGYAVMAVTNAFRRTKGLIKQSPMLWSAFSRARAPTGLLSAR